MAKTSIEGQGPPWAVEPVMMMMMIMVMNVMAYYNLIYDKTIASFEFMYHFTLLIS
jgi:hypothetical protein